MGLMSGTMPKAFCASAPKNRILQAAPSKMEMHRGAGELAYDHHSIVKAWLPRDDHMAIVSV